MLKCNTPEFFFFGAAAAVFPLQRTSISMENYSIVPVGGDHPLNGGWLELPLLLVLLLHCTLPLFMQRYSSIVDNKYNLFRSKRRWNLHIMTIIIHNHIRCIVKEPYLITTCLSPPLLTAASRMATTHTSPQVCRPHFHAPIPWLSEPKLTPSGSPWGSSFVCPQEPQDKVSQIQASSGHQSSGQHLFSFPPTPPKDSTPDSVQTGPTEYQVSDSPFQLQKFISNPP